MKGFGIYVKNDLLEPKHVAAMGEAVWLYLWLLDKMTSVNENGVGRVLGGSAITYEQAKADLGIHRNTYVKYVRRLRDAGYIQTLRTPYGMIISVVKAQKPFKPRSTRTRATKKSTDEMHTKRHISSDAHEHVQPDAHEHVQPDAHDWGRDAHDWGRDAHETVHVIKTIQDNTIDNTSITNVIDASASKRYGKPEINELFDFWATICGYNIESRVTANRRAASSLLKKHGKDKLEQLIRGVGMAHSDRYAPRISDFTQLQQKTNELVMWGRKKHGGDVNAPRSYKI
jgi:DNA-binding transcriptional regulator YhcF (GntR family)